jgi:hypothetical protein
VSRLQPNYHVRAFIADAGAEHVEACIESDEMEVASLAIGDWSKVVQLEFDLDEDRREASLRKARRLRVLVNDFVDALESYVEKTWGS